MKKLFLLLAVLASMDIAAQWNDLGSGIGGELRGVHFWANGTGMVCGDQGIYYTFNGGSGPENWTRYSIGPSPDSTLYAHTRFTGITALDALSGIAYCSGTDTVNDRAVIIRVDINTQEHAVLYQGTQGTALNAISYNNNNNRIHAVGDHGLIVRSTDLVSFTIVDTGLLQDLYSLSAYGSSFLIGGNEVLLRCSDQTASFTFTSSQHPGFVFKGVQAGMSTYQRAVGSDLFRITASSVSAENEFEPTPLDGRAITFFFGAATWVATGHGIFKGTIPSTLSYVEWQPSSGNGPINDIHMLTATNGYAVGANGRVLVTTNGGGPVKHYSNIFVSIGCANERSHISGTVGSAGGCDWFLDGEPWTRNCAGNYEVIFPASGMHTAQVITSGGANADTSTVTFHVPDPPLTDLAVSASDTILCKQGAITVSIAGTQTGVRYTLRDITHDVDLSTMDGNGGTIVLATPVIDETCDLIISARYILADCVRELPDTIHVRVEETTAGIHHDLINAHAGEPVNFYAVCRDAQNFAWTIGPDASISTSLAEDIPGVTFGSLGPTTVNLICWSDHACYDTLATVGPYIYAEPPPDSCWTMTLPGRAQGEPGVKGGVDTGDGFLVSGVATTDILLSSRAGVPRQITTIASGSFLAKYSYSGVLLWEVHSTGPGYFTITAMTELGEDGVALAGLHYVESYVKDNTGDSLTLWEGGGHGYVLRLDERGRYVRHARTYGLDVLAMASTPTGELVMYLHLWSGGPANLSYHANGVTTPFPVAMGTHWLLKTANDGSVIWDLGMENVWVEDIGVNAEGDVVASGSAQNDAVVRSANGGPSFNFIAPQNGGLFLGKWNIDGEYQWCLRTQTQGTNATEVSIAEDGAIYFSGRNTNYWPTDTVVVLHSDGPGFSMPAYGSPYVAKVDQEGNFLWGNGTISPTIPNAFVLALHHDEHGVMIAGGFPPSGSSNFTSIGTPEQACVVGSGDIFIVSYDDDGALQRVQMPYDTEPNEGNLNWQHVPLFRDTTGTIFLLGDFDARWQGMYYFGDSISTIAENGSDVFISKVGSNCGALPTAMPRQDLAAAAALSVMPNPVVNEMRVQLPGPGLWTMRVVDALGRSIGRPFTVNGSSTTLSRDRLGTVQGPMILIAESEGQRHACLFMVGP